MLTYEDFKEWSGMEITAPFFENIKNKSVTLIRFYTFDRVKEDDAEYGDTFKNCLLELMQTIYKNINDTDKVKGNIKSESIGKHSVSYETNLNLIQKSVDKEEYNLYQIVKKHFGITGLMYRGV